MSVMVTDDVTRYVNAVRDVLADLPAGQRQDLLDDLSQHLEEVAAETDSPLSVRLGPPAKYAAELRASIGLPPANSRGDADVRMEELAARVQRARDAAMVHPATRATLDFLPRLRPGWWVLRGYLAAKVLARMSHGGGFPFPTLGGSRFLGILLTLVAVVASVALGRRTEARPSWRRLAVVANILLVLVVLAVVGAGGFVRPQPAYGRYPSWSGYLMQPDGSPITNSTPTAPTARR